MLPLAALPLLFRRIAARLRFAQHPGANSRAAAKLNGAPTSGLDAASARAPISTEPSVSFTERPRLR